MTHLRMLVSIMFLLASTVSGAPTQAEIDSMVSEHNKFRKVAGSPPLKWDTALATAAQSWAAAGHMDHSTSLGAFKTYGENIHMSCPHDTPVTACKWWHDEISKYHGGDSFNAAHYTQMVWKSTEKFGCGKGPASCGGDLWVCQYLPMGNYYGKFKANVPQRLYDASESPEMAFPDASAFPANNMFAPLAFAAIVGGALVAIGVVVGRKTRSPYIQAQDNDVNSAVE